MSRFVCFLLFDHDVGESTRIVKPEGDFCHLAPAF